MRFSFHENNFIIIASELIDQFCVLMDMTKTEKNGSENPNPSNYQQFHY